MTHLLTWLLLFTSHIGYAETLASAQILTLKSSNNGPAKDSASPSKAGNPANA